MKPTLLVLRSEMYKGFWLLWNYRFNSLAELFIMGFIVVGVSFFLGRGQFDSVEVSSMLLGYIVWYFAMTAISNMSHNLMEEARTGTLEQMFMSPVPMGVILLGRVFAVLVTATAQIGLVAIALAVLM